MAKPPYSSIIDANLNPQQTQEHRVRLIKQIEAVTGRRLLVYVADIKKNESALTIEDKTGFSDLVDGVDVDEVDVLINSPGGFAEVTESIVGMLRAKYKAVRFLVPNAAKSAGTLLVLSGDEILMDSRSELGPTDPQIQYSTRGEQKREAAEAILEGFKNAKKALMDEGPKATAAYLPLLEKYTIGLLQACENAIKLSQTLASEWLGKYMFADAKGSNLPNEIAAHFGSHTATLSHSRAIRIDKCKELGLKIVDLDEKKNHNLRDLIWKLWCYYELHFERAVSVTKMYENSSGCHIQKQVVALQIVAQQPQPGRPAAVPAPAPAKPQGPLPGLPGGLPVKK